MRKSAGTGRGKKAAIAVLTVVLAAGAVFAGYSCFRTLNEKDMADGGQEQAGSSINDVDVSRYPYVRDTDYKNPFKYMDVYSYPFQKTEGYYKKNKDMEYGTDTLSAFAKEIIENIYNTNYSMITSSRDEYEEKFIDSLNTDGSFFLDAGPGADKDIMTAQDALEAIETYYVENSASTAAVFETDRTLVYEDGYLFCRGVLELETFEGTKSSKKAIPVEGVFYQDTQTGSFVYCGLIKIEGYGEFDIE